LALSTQLRLFYLFHLSKPASDRPIYQTIYRRRFKRIVELGMGTGERARRLIEVASRHFPAQEIAYTGIDPFEARGAHDSPGLALKDAYRLLRATGARVRLVPGDPLAIFSAMANDLGAADLVLIAWPLDRAFLPRACYYLQRMLHDGSLVLLEEHPAYGTEAKVRVVSQDRIRALAASFRKAA